MTEYRIIQKEEGILCHKGINTLVRRLATNGIKQFVAFQSSVQLFLIALGKMKPFLTENIEFIKTQIIQLSEQVLVWIEKVHGPIPKIELELKV